MGLFEEEKRRILLLNQFVITNTVAFLERFTMIKVSFSSEGLGQGWPSLIERRRIS